MEIRKADVIIIGSGIAGLYAAKLLAIKKKVVLITKGKLENNNSILAQGGIAAAIDASDNWENHFIDTIEAGSFHNDDTTTKELVKCAPDVIKQLIKLGVPFDKDSDNQLELGREGGHHQRRIVHAGGDATGREIIKNLIYHVRNNVTIYEDEMSFELIVNNHQCNGVVTKDKYGEQIIYHADQTILATGGIGTLYSLTSNDITVSGDGIAMAYRAGCELTDLEFIQFHPTMLVIKDKACGLISEAVRGEGARLINNHGQYIMNNIHPLKDLAPRDIVARTIFNQMQTGSMVYLDITNIKDFKKRFPTITKLCEDNHVSLEAGLLPIAPGAHFIMGGVKTDLNGETNIKDLYAIGEVAYTGVHGANRLASNSLLEGVVFANKVANSILQKRFKLKTLTIPMVIHKSLPLPDIRELQATMMNKVGIVRNETELLWTKSWLEQYLPKFHDKSFYNLSNEDMSKLNMILVSWLITTSALMRTESRGGHFRSDYPNLDNINWQKRYIGRRKNNYESHQAKGFTSANV